MIGTIIYIKGIEKAQSDLRLNFPLNDRNVDEVHDMMDDIAEQQDLAREISDAISNPVGFGEDVDEVRRKIAGKEPVDS